jgi:hypothetical protein
MLAVMAAHCLTVAVAQMFEKDDGPERDGQAREGESQLFVSGFRRHTLKVRGSG